MIKLKPPSTSLRERLTNDTDPVEIITPAPKKEQAELDKADICIQQDDSAD